MNLVDLDGESWGDKVVGILVGTLTNLIPFSSFLRDFYSPDNSTDYNNALKSTDKAAMITGEVLTTGGTAAMAAGTIATEAGGTLALSGVGTPAGAVATTAGAIATIAGATATAEGAILMANSASNSSQGYKRGKSGESSTSSGGTKTPSKTLWQSKDGNEPRIDFENSSNTGNRGRIHLHIDGKKYYYDDKGYSFYTETKTGERVYKSKSFNKHWLNKKEVHDAIEKGKRYLGK